LEFLKKHEADENVASVRNDFESLLVEFNKIGEKDAKPSKTENSNTTTLSGGTQLVITQDVYNGITQKIKSIRNAYTLTK
jgi:hypothetical protein